MLNPSTKGRSTSVVEEEPPPPPPPPDRLVGVGVGVGVAATEGVMEEVLEGVRVPVGVTVGEKEGGAKHSEVTGPERLKFRKGAVVSSQPSGMGMPTGVLSAPRHSSLMILKRVRVAELLAHTYW